MYRRCTQTLHKCYTCLYWQVKVGFHSSLSLLAYQSLPEEELPANVQLVHSDSGERRLRFQEGLVIEYNNSSVQVCGMSVRIAIAAL